MFSIWFSNGPKMLIQLPRSRKPSQERESGSAAWQLYSETSKGRGPSDPWSTIPRRFSACCFLNIDIPDLPWLDPIIFVYLCCWSWLFFISYWLKRISKMCSSKGHSQEGGAASGESRPLGWGRGLLWSRLVASHSGAPHAGRVPGKKGSWLIWDAKKKAKNPYLYYFVSIILECFLRCVEFGDKRAFDVLCLSTGPLGCHCRILPFPHVVFLNSRPTFLSLNFWITSNIGFSSLISII